MKNFYPLSEITEKNRIEVGGKGYALSRLYKAGFPVPKTLCLSSNVYHTYVKETPLAGNISLELSRKKFEDMRWEEMWDTSLRIRNHFIHTPLPFHLAETLKQTIEETFADNPVAVRSSAEAEDTKEHSFAGLHDSFLNISGAQEIINHIKKVWASLWSDSAILYRKELRLDIESSAMSVVIQEFLPGEVSGVVFSKNPLNPSETIIEAVPGLNEGLVDGKVEPDRWTLNRTTGALLSRFRASRDSIISSDKSGVKSIKVEVGIGEDELLLENQIQAVFNLVKTAESLFRSPQDVEWTFCGETLYILQSRPITRGKEPAGEISGSKVREGEVTDKREWYLSLRPNFEKLKSLRKIIEDELIPSMIDEAKTLSLVNLTTLTESELGTAVSQREMRKTHWEDVYWDTFIPFAHGVRLFGKVYNDTVQPEDPYEFVELLRPERMESLERDRLMADLAGYLRNKPELKSAVSKGIVNEIEDPEFVRLFTELQKKITGGFLQFSYTEFGKLLFEMADGTAHRRTAADSEREAKTEFFLGSFPLDEQPYAAELLDIARSSYQLRDDDNIYLGLIEQEYERALAEQEKRNSKKGGLSTGESPNSSSFYRETGKTGGIQRIHEYKRAPEHTRTTSGKERQLVGQPAGAGLVTGKARVLVDKKNLFNIKQGEIIVCDAIDPTMTFIVPLAAGIVERRGGMLIHGAIIAREYGLPCVTGIPQAVEAIHTGDRITVDGYLGIVVVH